MLQYDKIDIHKRIDVAKSNNSKECRICHYQLFDHGFKFQDSVCSGCHGLTMLCTSISNIGIITVKGVYHHYTIHDISKSEAIHVLENSMHEDIKMHINIKNRSHNYSDNLIKSEKVETKNTLIDAKNVQDLMYFTGYFNCKSIKMLSLYFYKLMGGIEKHEGKKIFDG